MTRGKITGLIIVGVIIVAIIIAVASIRNMPRNVFDFDLDGGYISGINDPEREGTLRVPSKIGGKEITRIADEAFVDCDATKIIIADGITHIGNHAFWGCSNAKTLKIGSTVEYIGKNAFESVTDITELELPYGLKTIDDGAFYNCYHLETINIPATVTEIGEGVFAQCNALTAINVDENNPNFKSIDGCLYTKDGKTLLHYSYSKISDPFRVPEHVTAIGDGAFRRCSQLKNIILPSTIQVIGYRAFEDSWLKTVTFEGECTVSIENSAFYKCGSLEQFNSESAVFTKLGDSAFYNCSKLNKIILNEGLESIGRSAFVYNNSLVSIDIPNTVKVIGESAFSSCYVLKNVSIPNNIEVIGSGAFLGCPALSYNEYENCYYLGNASNPYLMLIKIKNNYESLEFAIHKDTVYIESEAFKNSRIKRLTIPKTIKRIGNRAFAGCGELTMVLIDDCSAPIGASTFENCTALQRVVLGNKVTIIGDSAFKNCTALESIVIPRSTVEIGSSAFEGCSSLSADITINSVEKIPSYIFKGCTSLKNVVLGNSVKEIGSGAFEGCTMLENATIKSTEITSIGYGIFNGCTEALTIRFAVASSGPNWDKNWNLSSGKIEWSYKD